MTENPLDGFSPDMMLHPNVLWIIFAVAFLIFVFISIVLIFHWVKYSLDPVKATLFGVVYSVVSILLIVMTIISLGYYQISL